MTKHSSSILRLSVAFNCRPEKIEVVNMAWGKIHRVNVGEIRCEYTFSNKSLSVFCPSSNPKYYASLFCLEGNGSPIHPNKPKDVDRPMQLFARFSYAMNFGLCEYDSLLSEHEKMEINLQLNDLGLSREVC